MVVSQNGDTPKSSIYRLILRYKPSILGTPIYGNPHIPIINHYIPMINHYIPIDSTIIIPFMNNPIYSHYTYIYIHHY